MRYQTDPARRAVQLKMLEEVARAADLQKDGQWITYLIRDPRYPDKRGNEGTPIYVGQTHDFRERVLSRFNKCEKEAIEKGKDCIERRVADLLHLQTGLASVGMLGTISRTKSGFRTRVGTP